MKNVLLVTIDCLRWDSANPILDVFQKYRSAIGNVDMSSVRSPGPNTPMAFPSIMTGVPAIKTRIHLPQGGLSLAEIFQQSNYHTYGVSGGNPSLSTFYGYDRGFDHFEDLIDNRLLASAVSDTANANGEKDKLSSNKSKFGRSLRRYARKLKNRFQVRNLEALYSRIHGGYYKKIPYGANVNDAFFKIFDWTPEKTKPFFSWIHYLDAHDPYVPRGKFAIDDIDQARIIYLNMKLRDPLSIERLTDEDATDIWRLYRATIEQIAFYLDLLLTHLNERDALENTILILTADHGEGFGDNGYYLHPSEFHDTLLNVPFITNSSTLPNNSVDGTLTPIAIHRVLSTNLPINDLDIYKNQMKCYLGGSYSNISSAWFGYRGSPGYGNSLYMPVFKADKSKGYLSAASDVLIDKKLYRLVVREVGDKVEIIPCEHSRECVIDNSTQKAPTTVTDLKNFVFRARFVHLARQIVEKRIADIKN